MDRLSDAALHRRLALIGLVASGAAVLSVWSWEVVSSMTFMAVFFAAWQCVNAVFYARFSTALKIVQTTAQRSYSSHRPHSSHSTLSSVSAFQDIIVDRNSDHAEIENGGFHYRVKFHEGPVNSSKHDDEELERSFLVVEDPSTVISSTMVSPLSPADTAPLAGLGVGCCHVESAHSSRVDSTTKSSEHIESSSGTSGNSDQQENPRANGPNSHASNILSQIPEPPYSVAIVSLIALNAAAQIGTCSCRPFAYVLILFVACFSATM